MINVIKHAWKKFQPPQVYAEVLLDHIELSDSYLMLGLSLGWHNDTLEPIQVEEVHIRLYHEGTRQEPVLFYPQGHFAHLPGQKVIKKTVGAKSFVLPPGETHLAGIRFFTRTILVLADGTYPLEIHATVSNGTYVHEAQVKVTSRLKYRTSEPWIPQDSLV